MSKHSAVVPGYYLVCYNTPCLIGAGGAAVVPGYYLVCYNLWKNVQKLCML